MPTAVTWTSESAVSKSEAPLKKQSPASAVDTFKSALKKAGKKPVQAEARPVTKKSAKPAKHPSHKSHVAPKVKPIQKDAKEAGEEKDVEDHDGELARSKAHADRQPPGGAPEVKEKSAKPAEEAKPPAAAKSSADSPALAAVDPDAKNTRGHRGDENSQDDSNADAAEREDQPAEVSDAATTGGSRARTEVKSIDSADNADVDTDADANEAGTAAATAASTAAASTDEGASATSNIAAAKVSKKGAASLSHVEAPEPVELGSAAASGETILPQAVGAPDAAKDDPSPLPASEIRSAAAEVPQAPLSHLTADLPQLEVDPGTKAHAAPISGDLHAAPPAPPAPPTPPEARFADANYPQIVTGMRGQLLPDGGTMHIRLDPPELGALQVSVHMHEGVMTASFQTSNDDATRLLSHSMAQLKSVLESQGVNVDKLHVSQAPKEQPTGSDDNRQQQQSASDNSSARQEQQRREILNRMWKRLANGSDPLDLVA